MKPIIGIVGHPYINKDNNLIFQTTNSIVKKIIEYGGIPIIICPTQIENYLEKTNEDIAVLTFDEKNDLNDILKYCDAIIKPGGTRIYDYEKYIYEYTYINDIPYLGICAGMQMMSQYNSDVSIIRNNTELEHCSKNKYVHKIKIVSNTLLYRILKQDVIEVNSIHNYHISSSGIHNINAYSEDGIIEGIENKNKLFHLGVQWHPEGLDDINTYKIFTSFMDKAKVKTKSF